MAVQSIKMIKFQPQVMTTQDGEVRIYPLHLRKDEENKWVFSVSEKK